MHHCVQQLVANLLARLLSRSWDFTSCSASHANHIWCEFPCFLFAELWCDLKPDIDCSCSFNEHLTDIDRGGSSRSDLRLTGGAVLLCGPRCRGSSPLRRNSLTCVLVLMPRVLLSALLHGSRGVRKSTVFVICVRRELQPLQMSSWIRLRCSALYTSQAVSSHCSRLCLCGGAHVTF